MTSNDLTGMSGRAAYRVGEAARQLSISERHLWRLIDRGEITPIVRIGRVVLIPSAAIDGFLKRNQVAA